MPFKVTPYRLEMIADILSILGVISFVILLVGGAFLIGLIVLLTVFVFSYILYAVAKILKNTEAILEYLKESKNPVEEETDDEE